MADLDTHRRETAVAGAAFSDRVRRIIEQRSLGRCEVCGLNRSGMQIHHRRPRGMGGTVDGWVGDSPNGLMICQGCHRMVEDRRHWAYTKGLLVRHGWHSVDVPVMLASGWSLLRPSPPYKMRIPERHWVAIEERDAHLWEPMFLGVLVDEPGEGEVAEPGGLLKDGEAGPVGSGTGVVEEASTLPVPDGVDLPPDQGEEA